MNLRPKIALYEPDIPQNTAAIIRTCACLGADLEIIEPCGFLFSDKRFKRVVMDYMDEKMIKFYQSSDEFFESKKDVETSPFIRASAILPPPMNPSFLFFSTKLFSRLI